MANKANLELQFLNLQDTEEIIVKRFFLVHFVDPRLKGSNLRSYLCLIWRYNSLHLNNRTTILLKLTDKVTSSLKDVRYFFGEHFVLQQFWSSFRVLKSIRDFANSYKERNCSNPTLASSIIYNCYRNKKLDNDLIFHTAKEEVKYDHIIFPIKNVLECYDEKKKELIIFPQDLKLDEILSDPGLNHLDPTFLPCFAFWIGWIEELEVRSFKSFNYDITYDIEISNDLQGAEPNNYVKISDFYTYFFLPYAYELDSQACNYPSLTKYVNEDFELERSYSQKKLEYFDEWERFGIKSQAAFRTHLSKKFVEYFRNKFKFLQFSFTVVDRDSRLYAGLNLTIATIIIAILWELGHDKIKDLSCLQQIQFINPDTLWLTMNSLMFFGVIRVFFYKDWFAKGSSLKAIAISIGIIAYFIYYVLFMILNVLFNQPIKIIWLNNISTFLFQKYILIPFVAFGIMLFLINKIIFRNLYRKFKIPIFK